ncbi:MAG: peptidyl-tRNA hydrolase [Candidatus Midichloriaceae bacterium]|jgi:PTH1 family peptidyl-tRNA hydrolase|nr:peptidyl-tRNA hydrolase [Candidatus Midichloriaceae bacterium]
MDLLFVGLGNPGKEYENTRHNAGFLLLDEIASKFEASPYINKFNAHYSKVSIAGHKVHLLKPQTYMNLSGRSVLQALTFYKIKPNCMWVFHDDIDLKTGRIKVKIGGGNGGHNGLKSIDEVIGKEYYRVRIGVGKPQFGAVSDYVLQNFPSVEMEEMKKMFDNVTNNIKLLITDTSDKFLNKISL